MECNERNSLCIIINVLQQLHHLIDLQRMIKYDRVKTEQI